MFYKLTAIRSYFVTHLKKISAYPFFSLAILQMKLEKRLELVSNSELKHIEFVKDKFQIII